MEKKLMIISSVSATLIGLSSVVLFGANLMHVELPDLVIRALGIVNLISLPVMIYSNVQSFKSRVIKE